LVYPYYASTVVVSIHSPNNSIPAPHEVEALSDNYSLDSSDNDGNAPEDEKSEFFNAAGGEAFLQT
jgi:hypothetical protein